MSENNQSFIQKIFQSLKPYQVNKGQAQGISEVDAYESDYLYKSIYGTSTDKKRLFDEYKEMSMYPYAADAIDEIVHEAILRDKNGQVVKLNILDPDLSEKENVVKNLQKEFEYVVNKLLDFNTNSEDLFRKFYVEGELLAELVIDANKKEQGLKGVQYLPSYTMQIEYDDNNDPLRYIQSFVGMNMQTTKKNTTNNTQIAFEPTQIAYINSGIMDMKRRLVYSYLERAKVPFRQLKWMENALLVYRITRAPERRVFYIDIGKLPKSKADEYMKSIIRNFKNKKVYNPSTGEVEIGKDTLSMEEDFFFPTTSEGRGSKVETLPGAQNLGEIADVSYFLNKLYKALKIPITRLNPETQWAHGKPGEAGVTRDEIKFAKYVESIRNRFGDFIYQIFFTHLQLKGLVRLYQLDKSKLSIQFTENNSWKELKNLEMMRSRIEIFKDMVEYKEDIFPREFLLKSVMNLSDDEIKDIDEMLAKQKLGGAPSGEVPEEPVETPEEDTEVDVLLREPKANNLLIDRIKANTL